MIRHSLCSLTLFLALSAPPCLANESSDKEGNGGFAYSEAIQLLSRASDELVQELHAVDAKLLAPIGGQREKLIDIVTFNRLMQLPAERRTRDGHPLKLDYEPRLDRVVLLEPFYMMNSLVAPENHGHAMRVIKRELLHEAGHLFQLKEAEAKSFSETVMAKSDPSSRELWFGIRCPAMMLSYVKMNGKLVTPEAGILMLTSGRAWLKVGTVRRDSDIRLDWRAFAPGNNGSAEGCNAFYFIKGVVPGGKVHPWKKEDYTFFDLAPMYSGHDGGLLGRDDIVVR